jgi:hypothetical protein
MLQSLLKRFRGPASHHPAPVQSAANEWTSLDLDPDLGTFGARITPPVVSIADAVVDVAAAAQAPAEVALMEPPVELPAPQATLDDLAIMLVDEEDDDIAVPLALNLAELSSPAAGLPAEGAAPELVAAVPEQANALTVAPVKARKPRAKKAPANDAAPKEKAPAKAKAKRTKKSDATGDKVAPKPRRAALNMTGNWALPGTGFNTGLVCDDRVERVTFDFSDMVETA